MTVSTILTANSNASSTLNSATAAAKSAVSVDTRTVANNFTQFLMLLTTQLKNQNPLDPLDTNQFTQQLVQFAQVEQQLKANDQLATLVALQQTAQATTALGFVGKTVAVDGATTRLEDNEAVWNLYAPKPCTAVVNVIDSTGTTIYTTTLTMGGGVQKFTWDGKGTNGTVYPAGNYTITATGKDPGGAAVPIGGEIESPVESVDLTTNPPLLLIAGKYYRFDQIKRVIR